jgi:prevent-host-death family protein
MSTQPASGKQGQPSTRSVGISELRAKAGEIVRKVQESGVPVDITIRGQVVARVTAPPHPASTSAPRPWTPEESAAFWKEWDDLAAEIDKYWPEGLSAVDAVREQRRDL